MVLAVSIICDAIDRYKELCEGAYCGMIICLCRQQIIARQHAQYRLLHHDFL